MLGAVRTPTGKLTIRLNANGSLNKGQYPTVAPGSGELLLLRFTGLGKEYTASLAHELVHAWRWKLWTNPARQTDAFLFVEEGFAELMAQESGFPSTSFPTFGIPITIAAGSWLKTNEDLPLPALMRRHKTLNFRCPAQAYTLRVSFFTLLRRLYGLESVIELAYQQEPLTLELFQKTFGASVDELSVVWRGWVLQQFYREPNALKQAQVYREDTPIKYVPICTKMSSS